MDKNFLIGINFNNQLKWKKFFLEENLSNIREKLNLDNRNDVFFCYSNGRIDDEENVKLKEIITEKDGKYYITLKSDIVLIKFFMDDTELTQKNFLLNENLQTIREYIKNLGVNEFYFLKDKFAIELNDEYSLSVGDIIKNNSIFLKSGIFQIKSPSKTCINFYEKESKESNKNINTKVDLEESENILDKTMNTENTKKEEIKEIKIFKNNKEINKIMEDVCLTLFNFRKKYNYSNNCFFLYDGVICEDEDEIFIKEILEDNNLYILEQEEIKIFINNKLFKKIKISISNNLEQLREKINKYLKPNTFFLKDNCKIDFLDEKDFFIEELLENKNIYLKCENDITINSVDKLPIKKQMIMHDIESNNYIQETKENFQNFTEINFNIKEKVYSVVKKDISFLKKLNPKIRLDEARKILNLNFNEFFVNKKNKVISIHKENILNLNMIENENSQIIIIEKNNTSIHKPHIFEKKNIFPKTNRVNSINNIRYEDNNLIKFDIFLNGQFQFSENFIINLKLNNLRNKLSTKIQQNFNFLQKNTILPKDFENTFLLKDILNNNRIYLKTNNITNINDFKFCSSKELNFIPVLKSYRLNDINLKYKKSQSIHQNFMNDLFLNTQNSIVLPKYKITKTYNLIENAKFLKKQNSLDIYLYQQEKTLEILKNCKNILLIGQTGSGKTTLLNSIINYILKVDYSTSMRYILFDEKVKENQSVSQTSEVNEYYIKEFGTIPSIRIIDTPGFGDTRGLEYDQKIVSMIKDKFLTEIDYIDLICFVVIASNARLTINQEYIFNEIVSLFGNDVAENFLFVLTFSDGQKPVVLDALQNEKSPFSKIIPKIENPWYIKTNNSSIFSKKDKFSKDFYKLAMDGYENLIEKLKNVPKKSLNLSKEVLNIREKLKHIIEGLQPKLNIGLELMDKIRNQIKEMKKNKDLLDETKNYNIKTSTVTFEKIDLKPGIYTTLCTKCNYTCCRECNFSNDENKKLCKAMLNGFCRVCPGKCEWKVHNNVNYEIKYKVIEKIETIEELKKKYFDSKSKLSESEQIIIGLEKNLENIQLECIILQEEIKNCVNQLKKIALNEQFNNSNEYIDLVISNEIKEQKPGYLERISSLKELQKKNDMLLELYENEVHGFKTIDDFRNNFINEEKKKLKFEEAIIN